MILVTGATGFVGRRLIRRLGELPGLEVRVLLRPGSDLERLPHGVAVHAMIGDVCGHGPDEAALDARVVVGDLRRRVERALAAVPEPSHGSVVAFLRQLVAALHTSRR